MLLLAVVLRPSAVT